MTVNVNGGVSAGAGFEVIAMVTAFIIASESIAPDSSQITFCPSSVGGGRALESKIFCMSIMFEDMPEEVHPWVCFPSACSKSSRKMARARQLKV